MLSDKRALLFDLDGTLLDTAPDMIGALNRLRAESDLPPCDSVVLRQWVSKGSLGMLHAGMPACDEPTQKRWQQRFLELYSQDLSAGSVLFGGMESVLQRARDNDVELGIVTNKPGWLTDPLVDELNLRHWFGSIVSGDTLAQRKPHPAPVLLACEQLGVVPQYAWFAGDDERDIEAGRAASTPTVAVTWGYHSPGEQPDQWGADYVIHEPTELLSLANIAAP